MPVEFDIAPMGIRTGASQDRLQCSVKGLCVGTNPTALFLVKASPDPIDKLVLGVGRYLSFLQAAVLQRQVPVSQLLKDRFPFSSAKASFHSAPFPVGSFWRVVGPFWLWRPLISLSGWGNTLTQK